MATCEGDFQRELLTEFKAKGVRAYHIAERFKSGVVDLYIKHFSFPVCWVELKFLTSTNRRIPLTTLQQKFLREEREAGNYSAWVVCVEEERGKRWAMYAGVDPYQECISPANLVQVRFIGQKWDVHKLLRHISADCDRG